MRRSHHGACTTRPGLTPVPSRQRVASRPSAVLLALLAASALLASGCRSTGWLEQREDPYRPRRNFVGISSPYTPKLSARTKLVLRQYDLIEMLDGDPHELLASLDQIKHTEPSADVVYAYAELAHRSAASRERSDQKKAFDLYATSVAHAYLYLFDPRYEAARNAYDPQFRGACDLYNKSLDRALRLVSKHGGLKPGLQHACRSGDHRLSFSIVSRCEQLSGHEFEKFEFVSDFQVKGLPNRHQTFGLGVPLIAVRKEHTDQPKLEAHYPPRLAVPMTAFLRIIPGEATANADGLGDQQAVLELYDPLNMPEISVAGRAVPLQSDSTTPLAYFLENLEYTNVEAATKGLLWPGQTPYRAGLYMLEPYQPDKIPVLLVHGLWSSPLIWVDMFNDLRSIPEIRRNYQFWFFFYSTGQPFIYSASGLREELAEMRVLLDPQRKEPALDQMVLIGHSMGGLISRMQTVDSGDLFWEEVAEKPFDLVQADDETRQKLRQTFYFRPNPSVRRVVTIATPHGGSSISNSATQWLGRKFITLPPVMTNVARQLSRQNPGVFRDAGARLTKTSIEMLAPDSPALKALAAAPRAPWVTYHNIMGKVSEKDLWGRAVSTGDGVVSLVSARTADAASEIVVDADHSTIHGDPRSVLEVRRILLEHLAGLRQTVTPVGYSAAPAIVPGLP